ncbi:hypothetical protein llap_14404 [Limosa lapponica baueri]|uniref:UDENN domain-containing protein n=1 Tax=Limosa lapponica baueri TaxID=1758121 RepID=A0A2I0TNA6_LIMLA|nr:hypothetical protein llap_14404 [Limosa lapponica baueri]
MGIRTSQPTGGPRHVMVARKVTAEANLQWEILEGINPKSPTYLERDHNVHGIPNTPDFFFEYLVVVSLKKMTDGRYEPKITYQFPKRENLLKGQKEEEERLLKAIPLFCFPDGNNWAPVTEFTSETFSFVLTNVDGSRKIGYCRRLLPSGRGARPPEVFCIISCLGCFGLFSKILDEVEKRRQISMAVIYPFMQGLRESPFPAPGKTVTIKSFIPESGTELQNEMLASLNRHNNNNNVHTSEQVNALVSEAFVQFFVRMVGHYSSHIKWSKNGSGTFQERAFCKAIASKTNRKFVKKFVKTNMFSLFIEEAEKSRIPQEGKRPHFSFPFQTGELCKVLGCLGSPVPEGEGAAGESPAEATKLLRGWSISLLRKG